MRKSELARVLVLATCSSVILQLSSSAHEIDPAFRDLPYAEGLNVLTVPDGQDPLTARLSVLVGRIGTLASDEGRTLLPAGTSFGVLTFNPKNIARIELNVPSTPGMGTISGIQVETITALLEESIRSVRQIAGLEIVIRVGDGPSRPLTSFAPAPAPVAPDSEVSDDTGKTAVEARRERAAATAGGRVAPMALGGPVANADGQPAGALSGVVVFCTAGHGWTAGSSSWSLQRPLLLSMNEDYGNLEQLNYFVNYLYNAGATVVPFRPVGYQPEEVVLDNDDPGVIYTGNWTDSTTAAEWYENGVTASGIRYRYTTSNATETATARYTPNLPSSGFWPVYCWTRDNTDRVLQKYRIGHSGGVAEVRIDHQLVGKGWIWLGNFHFEAGTQGYVEISNQAATVSAVVADAIRFGNGMGTVVGAGPHRVSGYSREEEAQRYWAEAEAGYIETDGVVGRPTGIWDCCSVDSDDNVGTGARWARTMNRTNVNDDRWRRIYLEFHSNAAGGKGTVALFNNGCTAQGTGWCPTLNQMAYARTLGEKVEADMVAQNSSWEYTWGVLNNVFQGSYGAINTANNGDEFDATILEVAFHDHAEDAANLRSAKVRDAVARSSLQGMIDFLSNATTFPGTQVPPVYLPDPPEKVRATHDGSGHIVLSWMPGPARPGSPGSGDLATGYKIYHSSNGYGFGQAVDAGGALSATLSDVGAGPVVYLRVAAYNAGGESMPSETLAVRRDLFGHARVLVVSGYDRVSRFQNEIKVIPQGSFERPISRVVNSFDYIVQHATALAENGVTFDSASNEAVIAGTVPLSAYQAVVWILGRESEQDKTFDLNEQAIVQSYLSAGGRLFATGTDIGYELDSLNAGRSFYEGTLRANWVGDDSGVFTAAGSGGILEDVPSFSFNTADGAPYKASSSDRIAPQGGAQRILSYAGGEGAGIQYDSGTYRVVLFGFPFETIGSASVRNDIMGRVMQFLLPPAPCQIAAISGFEGSAAGTMVLFREPRYSATTQQHLLGAPNTAEVTTGIAPFAGTGAYRVSWQWVDGSSSRWLQLTTNDAPLVPNPAIDLRRSTRLRLRLDSGSVLVSLGVRETGQDVADGQNGGTSGPIEWVGASSVAAGAPQGVRVDAQPGVWQTITFIPSAGNVQAFTGDGSLWADHNKGVLEHLAFASTGFSGPLTVYLDSIEQSCEADGDSDGVRDDADMCPNTIPGATVDLTGCTPAVRGDFDRDGDVDQGDFGHLQGCMTGPFIPQTTPTCLDSLLDSDNDVDDADFALFANCLSGANVLADPACAN